jgi:tungstate transport system substrate-binding protein
MSLLAYRPLLALVASILLLPVLSGCDGDDQLILAMGTTIQDSGLSDPLFQTFENQSGYDLKVIAVGTGQALEMGRRGDADVVFVHSPPAERAWVAEGYGIDRRLVMYNDFVIAGPVDDPANVADAVDALDAYSRIAEAGEPFISRGDDSGTHKLELSIWEDLGIDAPGQDWYEETGQGMGVTLQVADQRDAYTMADRGTYLSLTNQILLAALFSGDELLLNLYHVIRVNPDEVDGVNVDGALALADFLVSREAQALIGAYGVEPFGRALFIPAAGLSEDELTVP